MSPEGGPYNPHFKIHQDDIDGIEAIYGKKRRISDSSGSSNGSSSSGDTLYKDKPDKKRNNENSNTPDLCKDPQIDVIFTSADGTTYVFKGKYYWKITRKFSLAPGYPKLISNGWSGLPNDIDAAFTDDSGLTFFFKGSQYWKYNGTQLYGSSLISSSFHGIPDNLDAVVNWKSSGQIFFLKEYCSGDLHRTNSSFPN